MSKNNRKSHSPEEMASLANDNGQLVKRIFEGAPFIVALTLELIYSGAGWCETRLNVLPSHQQQHGFVHAGVLMSIADHTCGGAAASMVPEDKDVISVENKTSFLRPASGAVLICSAKVLRAGRTLIFVEAEVFAEQDERRILFAKTSSTLAVIDRHR